VFRYIYILFNVLIYYKCFRGTDSSAYINIGRVLAHRCLEAGICEMKIGFELNGEKNKLLITEMEKSGIIMFEQPRYKYPSSWNKHRPEKPWEIHE